ncbi:hypothetical protein IU500_12555 [Nocardia terpenica]|uniref:hypothetical protein n=1 Tax=Nocardia terpenica TaxID=455432 RepID=UPI00189635A2|nr:hypothetical protein [Nocardia terpenica]MBF6062991.1 hypothetical protein [Nocardia terpenica]MBF6104874.1 hypothetical protein [Nocardia terpenica]MBF6112689.1 hypothetical protein [Nocardia terpenica]MBF6118602.1 hypothetical protein [Nocardia terpenica]MBF6155081.1 hypothetical protein [Nocardia terpenica]
MPRNTPINLDVYELPPFRPRTAKKSEPPLEIRRAWYAARAEAWDDWVRQRPSRARVAEQRGWGRRALVWGWW